MKYALIAVMALAGCVGAEEAAEKPAPALQGTRVAYTCATGGKIVVVYGEQSLTLPGPEMLIQEEGKQRWSWPSDGTYSIWELGADGLGTLSLNDGEAGTVTVQKSGCKADALPQV